MAVILQHGSGIWELCSIWFSEELQNAHHKNGFRLLCLLVEHWAQRDSQCQTSAHDCRAAAGMSAAELLEQLSVDGQWNTLCWYKKVYCRSCARLTHFTLQCVYPLFCLLLFSNSLRSDSPAGDMKALTWAVPVFSLHLWAACSFLISDRSRFPSCSDPWAVGRDTGGGGGCWLHGSGEQTCSLIRKLSSSVEGIFVSKFFSSSTKKYPLHTWITWNNYVVFLSFGPVPVLYQGDIYCRLYLEAKYLRGASDNVIAVPVRQMYTAWNALLWAQLIALQIGFSCVFRQCSVEKGWVWLSWACWWYSVDSGMLSALKHLSDFYVVILCEV